MGVLDNIQPMEVLGFFEAICGIPHGSKNTEALSTYLVDFAKQRNLTYRIDKKGNVIMWKDGANGGEGKEPVILQGHTDMVCAKDADCPIDMEKEPIELIVEGDTIHANKTTLGGDDGIAVAIMLAILDSKSINHPPIEAIFTVDEEIGLLGAAAIELNDIKGRRLINIDSESEGIFTVGCAGGAEATCLLPISTEQVQGPMMNLIISGLTGGHSGTEINKYRANANVLLGRCLQAIGHKFRFSLIDIKGGSKNNAIPVDASAQLILLDVADDEIRNKTAEAVKLITDVQKDFKKEYGTTDPKMNIVCRPVFKSMVAKDDHGKFIHNTVGMSADSTTKVMYMLNCLPDGIQRMNPDDTAFVQTSLNQGVLEKTDKAVILTSCVRSSVASEKDTLLQRLSLSMKVIGGAVKVSGIYPGWEYKKESPLREQMVEIFKEQYGREPVIEVIHAGLECGFFSDKIKDLDCISIGPDIKDIHTSRESMDIPSLQRTYKFILSVLEKLA